MGIDEHGLKRIRVHPRNPRHPRSILSLFLALRSTIRRLAGQRPFYQRFTNYDVYERHTVVRPAERRAPRGVRRDSARRGGRRGLLAAYVPYVVTAVNPDGTGDETVDGTVLPYAPRSFDAVVTIDTLEHDAGAAPGVHAYVLRRGGGVLVIADPFGSIEHMARERELKRSVRSRLGAPHPYLAEHTMAADDRRPVMQVDPEAGCVAPGLAGDYRWQADAFERHGCQHRSLVWRSTSTTRRSRCAFTMSPCALTGRNRYTTWCSEKRR